jgi:hypothetical protein
VERIGTDVDRGKAHFFSVSGGVNRVIRVTHGYQPDRTRAWDARLPPPAPIVVFTPRQFERLL